MSTTAQLAISNDFDPGDTASWRYLPLESNDLEWGLYIMDCGYTLIPPNSDYPPNWHPSSYRFTWDRGRRIDEYQLVYITKGKGAFESEDTPLTDINAGDLFFLYPGKWHRYRPGKQTGWEEHWVGFNGDYAERLVASFEKNGETVLSIGIDPGLVNCFQRTVELLKSPQPGDRQIAAAITIQALSITRAKLLRSDKRSLMISAKIEKAKHYLLENFNRDIDLQLLASELGVSYSLFRKEFRKATASSPRKYQLIIRVNYAKDLLLHSPLSISEIADELGFSCVYYFSKFFKQKTGKSPSGYRANS